MEGDPGRRNPLTLAITEGFNSLLRQLMFCLPGKVRSFDPDTQLAQVECGIQRVVAGEPRTIAVITNVPVHFAGNASFYFWHEVGEGTEGLIHFSQRAIDTWIDQGGPVAPHEHRMLSAEDAFFVPGVRSQPGKIPSFSNDGAGLGNYAGDTFLHLKADGSAEMQTTGDVTINGARITSDGDVITASGVSLTNHPHSQGPDSDGNSEVDTDPPTATE